MLCAKAPLGGNVVSLLDTPASALDRPFTRCSQIIRFVARGNRRIPIDIMKPLNGGSLEF